MRTVDADKLMERAKMHSILVSPTLGHFDYGLTLGMLNEIVKECETSAPVGDMVSRQAVLNLLSSMPPEEATTKAMLMQSVKQMDAAQSERKRGKGEEMSDLIDRKAAIDAICKSDCGSGFCGVPCQEVNALEALPSVQPERKRGKWVEARGSWYTPGGDPVWECSECGKGRHVYGIEHGSYGSDVADGQWVSCPNCGADMREVDDE